MSVHAKYLFYEISCIKCPLSNIQLRHKMKEKVLENTEKKCWAIFHVDTRDTLTPPPPPPPPPPRDKKKIKKKKKKNV